MKNFIAILAMASLLHTNSQNHQSAVDPNSSLMPGSWNTATGYFTLYNNTGEGNTATGNYSLLNNISGSYNTANGYQSLYSNTNGYYNTSIGSQALNSNISGSYNTANGYQSLFFNHNGTHNTSIGSQALFYNHNGTHNTAVGHQALYNVQPGSYNSAYGPFALWNLYNGYYNTANGNKALFNIQTGNFNTATGNEALMNLTNGSENTGLGSSTQTSGVNAHNQTIIGSNAVGQADNSVVLGNAEVTAVYMAQDAGAKVYAGEGNFSGQLTIGGDILVSSDTRLKANIVSLGSTLAKLLLIDGKTYTMKKDGKQKIGLLAQDIKNVFPELVSEDDHEMLAVNYQGLIPILINALKEQDAKISRLEQLTKQLITNE